MTNPQDPFFDFYRAGLKATGGMIRASLEGAERLRKQQLAAIDESLASHARAIAEIDNAKGIEELVAVQGRLAGAQYQAVIDYWSRMYQAASESQAELTMLVQAQAAQIRPVMAALQPLMDMASSAHALTGRATEETANGAAPVATANAGIRRGSKQAEQKSA